MNIHKFDNIPDKPFHSSGYAEVSNGGSIGSTSSQTFGQRSNVDQNRTAIRKYRDSHVGRGSLRHHAREGMTDPFGRVGSVTPPSRQGQNATGQPGNPISSPATPPPPAPREAFREPPTRGFNPYS